jgi:hypothetical protein
MMLHHTSHHHTHTTTTFVFHLSPYSKVLSEQHGTLP